MTDFTQFWALYPRKIARAHALKMWNRLTDQERAQALQALPLHIRYWQAAGRSQEVIPHAGTWLNGRRWEDELEAPEQNAKWWATQAGIEAKAKELGVEPKAGEGWHELKARITARIAA